jgi:hypothetical protein
MGSIGLIERQTGGALKTGFDSTVCSLKDPRDAFGFAPRNPSVNDPPIR